MSEEVMFFLSKEQLDDFRAKTVKEVISSVRKEEAKVLRANDPVTKTRRKLKKYRQLKRLYMEDADNVEFTEDEQIELKYRFLEELMGTGLLSSEILKMEQELISDEKKRLQHIFELNRMNDAAYMLYDQCAAAGGDALIKYDVLIYAYFEEKERTMDEIAEVCNIAKRTAYKYLNEAVESFAFYLFGM